MESNSTTLEDRVPTPPPNGSREEQRLDLTELMSALQAVRNGDFSVRLPADQVGLGGKIADAFNEIVASNQVMARQLELAGRRVGREGDTKHRVRLALSSGAWGEMEDSLNHLIDDLLWPVTEVTRAVSAVAQGNLMHSIQLEVDGRPLKGEFLRSASIVNTMVKQLGVFASEVTRVAREVGTDGKLGGQAQVPDVGGTWKDLTDSVNSMAGNLTAQVRNIAEVATAIAGGDLSRKITVDVRGEVLQLKETVNTMVDQLNAFAGEVTRVAREVDHRTKNTLALVHELATNAAKYGALSTSEGKVAVRWHLDRGTLVLEWQEHGGPPVSPPAAQGFGTKITKTGVEMQLGGRLEFDWQREGLSCRLTVPNAQEVLAEAAEAAEPGNVPAPKPQASLTPQGSGRWGRILLVEDEALVGWALRDLLVDAGYEVVGPIGRLADATAAAARESVDHALIDVNLAGEMSYPVAEALRRKGTSFVFLTGYDESAIDKRFEDMPVLNKPIDTAALLHLLAAARHQPASLATQPLAN